MLLSPRPLRSTRIGFWPTFLQSDIRHGLDKLHATGSKAVERAPTRGRVRAKVRNINPIANVHLGELLALEDTVEGVAGRAIDGRDVSDGVLIGLYEVELGVGVVEHNAVE